MEPTIQDLAVRGIIFGAWWTLLSLTVYVVVGQVVKPALSLWVGRKPRLDALDAEQAKAARVAARKRTAFWRYAVRLLAIGGGGLAGMIPLWPDWVPYWGGIMAGAVAGSFSTVVHAIVKARLPSLADSLSGAAVHVLKGSPADHADPEIGIETDTFDAQEEP